MMISGARARWHSRGLKGGGDGLSFGVVSVTSVTSQRVQAQQSVFLEGSPVTEPAGGDRSQCSSAAAKEAAGRAAP